MFLLLFLAVVSLTAYLSYKLSIRRYEKSARALPGDQFYTILGDLERLFTTKIREPADVLKLFLHSGRKFKDHGIMRAWFGPFLFVFTWDPKYVEEVAVNPNTVRKGKLIKYLFNNGFLRNGLVTNEGNDDVKNLRRPLTVMMKKKFLDTRHHELFLINGRDFVERLKTKTHVNILEETNRLSMDIFGETHLGMPRNDFKQWTDIAVDYLNRYVSNRIKSALKIWPLLTFWYKYATSPELIKSGEECARYIIDYRKKKMEAGEVEEDYEFYPDAMLKKEQRQKHPENITISEILEVMLAGGETSATTLASILVFLGMHPEIQEALYEEQKTLFADDLSRDPTPEDLPKMELLTRVMKESMRLVSAPFLHKETTEDIKLVEYEIPKGTFIVVYINGLHRNSKHWEKPFEFYPDHFLPEKVRERPDYAYIPFGIGQRRCPGELYAKASLLTLLSIIVRNYKFTSNYKFRDLRYVLGILTKFEHHFYDIEIERRHPESS